MSEPYIQDGKILFNPQAAGLAGQWTRILFGSDAALADPQPRSFQVIVTLCRPGHRPPDEGRAGSTQDSGGDSYLALKLAGEPPAPERIRLEVTIASQRLVFVGLPNAAGNLGKLTADIEAASLGDAEAIAFDALSTYLSDMTLLFDLPFEIYRVDGFDLRNGAMSGWFPIGYQTWTFETAFQSSLSPELRGYASMYREALSSNSPFYQFLCLYKILERLQARRGIHAERMKAQGLKPLFPKLSVPESDADLETWLRSVHHFHTHWNAYVISRIVPADARGRSFKSLLDNELRMIRNNIAHGLFDDAEEPVLLQSTDRYAELSLVRKWLPLMQTLARTSSSKTSWPESIVYDGAERVEMAFGHHEHLAGTGCPRGLNART